MQPSTRRQFLATAGAVTASALAGCGEEGNYDRTAGIAQQTADWPTIGHGYAHTGYAPEEAGPTDDPEIAWQHDIGIPRGTPVIVGDRVIAPVGNSLTCFRLEDGEPLWEDIPEDRTWTTPTVVEDRVFVASGHGGMRVLDLETGERRRTVELPGYVTSPPTPDYRNRRLFIGTDEGTIHSFGLEDDADDWQADLFGQFDVALSPTHYGVYAASKGGEVYCLDAEDGRGRWRTKLPGIITAAPAAVKGDAIVPCWNGKLYFLESERAGEPDWVSDRGGFVKGSLSVAAGTVFGASGSEVVAIDVKTGAEAWSADVGGMAGGALAVAGDTLYAGSFGGEVHAFALDGPTSVGPLEFGGRKWSRTIPGGGGEGAAVANGTLVTMGEGGEDITSKLVAFR